MAAVHMVALSFRHLTAGEELERVVQGVEGDTCANGDLWFVSLSSEERLTAVHADTYKPGLVSVDDAKKLRAKDADPSISIQQVACLLQGCAFTLMFVWCGVRWWPCSSNISVRCCA